MGFATSETVDTLELTPENISQKTLVSRSFVDLWNNVITLANVLQTTGHCIPKT